MNITTWTNKAINANKIASDAKASAEAKTTVFNELAFGALQILLGGKVQEEVALVSAVSKSGPFHKLRQCVSNARGLLDTLNNGELTVVNKREKTSATFTKEQVLQAEMPLFSVAQAYKATRPEKSDGASDKDFIALALEAEGSGLTPADILKMSAPAIDDYVSRGRAIHEAANSPLMQCLALYNKLTDAEKQQFVAQATRQAA